MVRVGSPIPVGGGRWGGGRDHHIRVLNRKGSRQVERRIGKFAIRLIRERGQHLPRVRRVAILGRDQNGAQLGRLTKLLLVETVELPQAGSDRKIGFQYIALGCDSIKPQSYRTHTALIPHSYRNHAALTPQSRRTHAALNHQMNSGVDGCDSNGRLRKSRTVRWRRIGIACAMRVRIASWDRELGSRAGIARWDRELGSRAGIASAGMEDSKPQHHR